MLAAASLVGAGCTGRTQQAIVVQQGAGTKTGTQNSTDLPGAGDSSNQDSTIDGSSFRSPTATSTSAAATQPPGSGGTAAAGVTINQTQADGSTKAVSWDGKSFLGNDKFDLSGN
jgi:hypothetical protein